MLDGAKRRQIDRKTPLAQLAVTLQVFERWRDKFFYSVRLLALGDVKSVKPVNKPGVARNDVSMRNHIAELAVRSQHADKKIVLAGLGTDEQARSLVAENLESEPNPAKAIPSHAFWPSIQCRMRVLSGPFLLGILCMVACQGP